MASDRPVDEKRGDERAAGASAASIDTRRFTVVLVMVVLAVWALSMSSALAGAALSHQNSGTVLVLFPPADLAHGARRAIVDAGGQVLEKSLFGNAWIARSSEPGFVGQLLARGAWRVLDPTPIKPLIVLGWFRAVPAASPTF